MATFDLADLRQVVEACVGTDNIGQIEEGALDVRLDELGLDSLAAYEIVTRLQDELGVRIPDEEVDRMKTPRSIIEIVNARMVAKVG
jgi:acyl carrier protein